MARADVGAVEGRSLVTGATGFIGSHLVRSLVGRDSRVVCLVRERSRLDRLASLPVELAYGDLADPAALRRAVAGVTHVYHLAGLIKARRREDFHRVNAEGTARLLEACSSSGAPLPRIVLVSSLAACGASPVDRPLTEEVVPRPLSAYGRSKLAAEEAARAYASQLPIVVVRPPVVYGPGDRATLPLFRFANLGIRPLAGDPRLSLIYVDDLVCALILAGQSPAAVGRTYFVSGDEQPSLDEVTRLIATCLGRRSIGVRVPYPVAYVVAGGAELAGWLSGRPAIFSRDKVLELYQPAWCCRPDRARHELGFTRGVSLAEGIRRTAHWYRRHGWL